MRILHAPSNIAGQAWALAQGLRALGHKTDVWHYGPNPFGFPCDRAIPFPPEHPRDLWPPIIEALEEFDVFHFHFGRSLVPRQIGSIPGLWDLPLYRSLGKRVFFTFHGSDVRLKSKHVAENLWSYYRFADIPCDEDDIKKRLNIIRTYANGMFICSPVNRPYVPDASFHPRAIEVERWPYVGPRNSAIPLVIHAPSARGTKGTDVVLHAVEKARDAGLKFEFRLVEGLAHGQMKDVLSQADIIVDNLLLGDYEMTGLEALCLGKTVIARVDEVVREQMGDVPILNADPESFVRVLTEAITDPDLRAQLAVKGRAFVEAHHDAKVVAAQLVRSYERPPGGLTLSFPSWAALAEARREERLERQIVELRTALRTRRTEIVVSGLRRGPFTFLGSRIDSVLRWVLRLARRLVKGRTSQLRG